tara:strand:- start:170 stop:679 length:510 start_codon:yes stop_codon:yes gene_type:complete
MKNSKIIKALCGVTSKNRGFALENIMAEHDGHRHTMAATNGTLLLMAEFSNPNPSIAGKGFIDEETGKFHPSEHEHPNWRNVLPSDDSPPDFTVSLDALEKMVKALKQSMGARKRGDMVGVEFRTDHPTAPVTVKICPKDVAKAHDGSDAIAVKIQGAIMPLKPEMRAD